MLAVIGGSGLYSLKALKTDGGGHADTPYGRTSGPVVPGKIGGLPVVFLARHGTGHEVPAHMVNYRANVRALVDAGATRILAVCSVGGIGEGCVPGAIVVPDQIIDYTWGREHTFAGEGEIDLHNDFTHPFSARWRRDIITAMDRLGFECVTFGTYGATQGPRFETAAEVDRLERDGCTVVGMTGMPEAALARELGVEYAAVCPVGNLAAGRGREKLTMGHVVGNVAPVFDRVESLITALTLKA